MKNFFIGTHHLHGAPAFVNRELLKYLLPAGFKTHFAGAGLRRRFSVYWGILTSRRIIVSGVFLSSSEVRLMNLLGKKFIYLMHGSYFMETGNNHPTEDLLHRLSSRIVSVSDVHAQMIKDEFPQYAEKVVTWFNGINWDEVLSVRNKFNPNDRERNKIILFGGGRHMKGNLEVCRAVEELNAEYGLGLHVDVYGEIIDDDFSRQIAAIPCVNYLPLVPKNKVLETLARANIFIANSRFETFNLSVMEAIGVGCNVLISKNVGAKDVIPGLEPSDIITDVDDIPQIKTKILHLLERPNNERLFASIDLQETSWKNRANQLVEILNNI